MLKIGTIVEAARGVLFFSVHVSVSGVLIFIMFFSSIPVLVQLVEYILLVIITLVPKLYDEFMMYF